MTIDTDTVYQLLFQQASDAVLLVDCATMQVIMSNPAAQRLSNYSEAALATMTVAQLFAPVPDAKVETSIGVMLPYDGFHIPVSIGVSTVVYDNTSYMLLIVRNMSEHQRKLQSEKLNSMERLTSSIAHEINNPLQALHNTIHLLLNRPFPEEKRERLLQMAKVEVDRLTTIVQRILELNRATSDDMRPLSVHTLIESALGGIASTLQEHQVLVERDWAERLPWVNGIGGHLRQVFVDLAVNAAEAMPAGGQLKIRTWLEHDSRYASGAPRILIEFADTGPGLPDNEAQRIFEPFYTLKQTSAGLGLSISYSIIERHGGMLSVSSGQHGTTFRVELPVAVLRDSG